MPRMHEHELDFDVPLVRGLLADQAPAYAELPLRRVASGGTENAVFRLGGDLAVRLPLHRDAVSGLLKETRWLPVVAPHLSLEVPEIVAVGEPDADYPFPWTMVRWLSGDDALRQPLRSLRDTAVTLGAFVTELQAIDMTDAPAPGSEGFSRGGPLAEQGAGFEGALARCEGLLDPVRTREVWEDALSAPDWDGPPVWLHADLLPSNLLVREGRLVGVLDFGAMATGDPAYDLTCAWHVLDRDSREAFRDAVAPDEASWRRARGLVVNGAVNALPYYLHTNPSLVAIARRGLGLALACQE
jgi:aminoglycoside phosphotransferase (APT) family kinase protein